MKITKLLLSAIVAMSCCTLTAQDFDTFFNNKTLRLDYIFGADTKGCHVMLDKQAVLPEWSGRRHRLKELPLAGNGQITVRDEATGDTIYRHSFSSLFNEWLSTEEASTTPKAFQNTYLVPLPKAPALIDIALLNTRHDTIASMTHRYRADDELIAVKGITNVTPHRYIHRSSHPEKAIDVAILAEGYTTAEMDSFYHHAAVAVESILKHEPFKSRADDFNFVAVASPSIDSGVSVPRLGDWKKTAFSSHFSTFYSDRYLTTGNLQYVHDALAGIPYEHIIILANTPEYGGGGIYNSYTLTTARHRDFRPVVVHEFGHSFGGLADEYFYENDIMDESYPLDIEPWEPNITTLVDFPSKWQSIVPEGTPVPTDPKNADKYPVGVYEGGGYVFKGVYRPADQCRMRNNTWPAFCPACPRALSLLIDFYTK